MHIGAVDPPGSLLHAAVQQQISTSILSKVHNIQRTQGDAAVAAINATADEAEQTPDSDDRGGRFQAIA